MTSNPFTIEIQIMGPRQDNWTDHSYIHAYAVTDRRRPLADNVIVQRWSASLLTRLAASLRRDMNDQVDDCTCPSICRLFVSDPVVTLAGITEQETPTLVVLVHRNAVQTWKRRIKSGVSAINKADRWLPTPADERTWTGEPEHLAVPPFTPTKATAR